MTRIPERLKTDHPREVIEATLAHVVQSRVEAAYARSDLIERRRRPMDDWAAYLDRGHGQIVPRIPRGLEQVLRLARDVQLQP